MKNNIINLLHEHKVWLSILIFGLTFLSPNAADQAIGQSATNRVAVDSLQVGDTFNYSIITQSPSEYDEVIFPDTSDFGEPIQIVDRKRYKVSNFVDSLSYTLQYFGTQSYTIPKLPVRFISDKDTTTLFIPPVPLDFKSTLKSKKDSLLPLKPIFDFAISWWPYLVGILIVILLGYVAYRGYKRWKTTSSEPSQPPFTPEPFTDPLVELEENLQTIRSKKSTRFQQEEFKRFYSELGDVLRLYLERVYQIPALESTSRELLNDLYQQAAPEPLIDSIKSILREADMVKFARFTPTVEQAEKALKEADQFLKIARHQDQQRIEYLRDRHQQEQEQLKTAHESTESTEDREVTDHV